MKQLIILTLISLLGCNAVDPDASSTDDAHTDESTVGDGIVSENPPGVGNTTDDTNIDTSVAEEEESPITWTDCDQWPGSHPCDFTLTDQNGNDWNLYSHYGTTMVIDFSTMWCSVCKSIAPDIQSHQDSYTSQGYDFLWVTVLIDDAAGGTVELSEVQDWSNAYGMTTSPVLVGSRALVDLTGMSGYPISSWPTLVVISDEMVLVQGINGWNESTILGWVDDLLK
jgi:cytochrome oxidase Cu insertion factor (SCO1/SenC/PrrC family)